MKKFFTVALVLLLCVSLSGCMFLRGQSGPDDGFLDGIGDLLVGIFAGGQKANEVEVEENKLDLGRITAPVVLFDEANLTITATDLSRDQGGVPVLTVKFENGTDFPLSIASRRLSVNNYMISDGISVDLSAGETAIETLCLPTDELDRCRITRIGKITLEWDLIDPNNGNTLLQTDPATIYTTANDSLTYAEDTSGKTMLTGDVTVLFRSAYNTKSDTPTFFFYLKNNTEKNLVVALDQLSVDGNETSGFFYAELSPEAQAVTDLSFYWETTEIEPEELVFSLLVYEADIDSDDALESGPLTLSQMDWRVAESEEVVVQPQPGTSIFGGLFGWIFGG